MIFGSVGRNVLVQIVCLLKIHIIIKLALRLQLAILVDIGSFITIVGNGFLMRLHLLHDVFIVNKFEKNVVLILIKFLELLSD